MLVLTFLSYISLGVAIAVDVGTMLVVTLNGVSLLEKKDSVKAQQQVQAAENQGGDGGIVEV